MIIVITGPTCLGKSQTAIEVAKKFNAEIVNGDAFQAYQEMDIGVAKPTIDELAQAKHHLYSYRPVDKPFSIAAYQSDLRQEILSILSEDKNVVIVGGSGLYIRAALYDYKFNDEEVFDTSIFDNDTNESLYQKLTSVDPLEAKKIHPNNRKRLIRALVIFETQNKRKSEIVMEQKHEPIFDDVFFYVRDMPRDELYERINKRVDEMMAEGLLEEVKTIYLKYGPDIQSMQAIGYKEFVNYFNNHCSLEETVNLIKQHTRNYAKRQMTFIRHQFPVVFYKDSEDLIGLISRL